MNTIFFQSNQIIGVKDSLIKYSMKFIYRNDRCPPPLLDELDEPELPKSFNDLSMVSRRFIASCIFIKPGASVVSVE